MEANVEQILCGLTDIQTYLRKLGCKKKQYKIIVHEKILKAKQLYSSYKNIMSIIPDHKISLELDKLILKVLGEKIELSLQTSLNQA